MYCYFEHKERRDVKVTEHDLNEADEVTDITMEGFCGVFMAELVERELGPIIPGDVVIVSPEDLLVWSDEWNDLPDRMIDAITEDDAEVISKALLHIRQNYDFDKLELMLVFTKDD